MERRFRVGINFLRVNNPAGGAFLRDQRIERGATAGSDYHGGASFTERLNERGPEETGAAKLNDNFALERKCRGLGHDRVGVDKMDLAASAAINFEANAGDKF